MNNQIDPTIQTSRKLFGYALKFEPAQLYHELNSPTPTRLAEHAAQHVLADARRTGFLPYVPTHPGMDGQNYLNAGIDNVRSILETCLQAAGDISKPQAESIANHPTTIQSMALLALRSEDALDNLIHPRSIPHYYSLNTTRSALTVNRTLVAPQADGCPFAKPRHETKIDPLFEPFSRWAGALAVESIYTHQTQTSLK